MATHASHSCSYFVVFNRKSAVTGAQTVETYKQILQELAAESCRSLVLIRVWIPHESLHCTSTQKWYCCKNSLPMKHGPKSNVMAVLQRTRVSDWKPWLSKWEVHLCDSASSPPRFNANQDYQLNHLDKLLESAYSASEHGRTPPRITWRQVRRSLQPASKEWVCER